MHHYGKYVFALIDGEQRCPQGNSCGDVETGRDHSGKLVAEMMFVGHRCLGQLWQRGAFGGHDVLDRSVAVDREHRSQRFVAGDDIGHR